jgi:uncharacterized membrane protein
MKLSSARLTGVDALRGYAVLIMILDHVAAAWMIYRQSVAGWALHVTIGRLAMPCFMLLIGAWYARRPWKLGRWVEITTAGVLACVANWAIGFGWIDVLVQAVGVALVLLWLHPINVFVFGVLQATTWTVQSWPGYQPGVIAACMAVGIMCRDVVIERAASLYEDHRLAAAIGRNALAVYVGHLWAIVGVLYLLGVV